MPEPQITVLIDTYNHGHFLNEAIESVLSQDFPLDNIEILIVDDGSTDDTAERVRKYGSRIKYFQKENGGQSSALNFGLARSRGEIIALLDGDDYWLPDKLRTVMHEFETRRDVGLVYHSLWQYHPETNEFKAPIFTPVSGFLPDNLKDLILFDWMFTSSIAFRRSVLERLLPIPEGLRIQSDGYLCALTVFLTPIAAINHPLGVYRLHGNNLFFQNSDDVNVGRLKRRIESSREMVKALTDWLTVHGFDLRRADIRATIRRWILMSERDEFLLSPPGRIRFFRHLLKSSKQIGPVITVRIQMVNYLNAVGSLVVGYSKFHLLDEARQRATHWIRHGNPFSSYLRRKSLHRLL